ncbi:ubiquitin carboxyl-terminal hydrolase 32-like isoform X2 [Tigriopus californicus]|uniref:ubiquitin carboxyl-terminal hydrolase 32-like isoform X2 n=1 Tax=Tigriopus californicus TaxID=6832 RepID=UPI0027DA9761|nr:ubiquitin carboxyl-terminal hydrolase 32-like isoform X2 [Tigriopus californicus]
MGGKESKAFPITSDEALKRVSESERRRLQDAFRRLATNNGQLAAVSLSAGGYAGPGSLSRATFVREVLGEGVPPILADRIFALCGGGVGNGSGGSAYGGLGGMSAQNSSAMSASTRGLNFREVLSVLVLITRGTADEKMKFLFGVLASDSNNTHIDRSDLIRFLRECDPAASLDELASLFAEGDKVNYDKFSTWLSERPRACSVSEWLLVPNMHLNLVNKLDTPTFYQTLAGVTHLEEQEIVELEKRFWTMAGNSASGQIDLQTIRPLVSPPLPHILVSSFFSAFDENLDGHIDFKELSCGVSAACRGPEMERQKFCFKIFDTDRDGVLNENEMRIMCECLVHVRNQNASTFAPLKPDIGQMISDILERHDPKGSRTLSVQEFLVWTVNNPYPEEFSRLIFQICHIVLGLRPLSRSDERDIVKGWLEREEKAPLNVGTIWHLINMDWWNHWNAYVSNSQEVRPPVATNASQTPNGDAGVATSKRSGKKSLDSTLAMDSNSGVIGTSYQQLNENGTSSEGTPSLSPYPSRKTSAALTVHTKARPGLIDNTPLVQSNHSRITSLTAEGGKLKTSVKLVRGKDFELIPERLWRALVLWYGGSPSLPRQVIRNKKGEVELELNPLSVKLLKHQVITRPSNVSSVVAGYSAAAATISATTNGTSYGSNLPSTTRRYHAYQAAFSRRTTIKQISEFLSTRLHLKLDDMRLWQYKDDTQMNLLEDENCTLEDAGLKDEGSLLVEVRSRDGTWPEEITSLCNNNSDRRASVLSTNLNVRGVTGLTNLGNTCYMNTALQCVFNTKILAEYFSRNCHLYELNRTNPLGMKGHVAKRFGDLIKDVWTVENKAIAPFKLRGTIAKYQPHFGSAQQQDAQELLSFLLDGLHEDLNRVTDKPYVELKDSDGRADLEVAAEAWENHVIRNRSIVVDLFHGQFKSKVTCKVCGHESVRFDPFTFLTLPLPMESSIHLEVIVIKQDGSVPIKYGLTLNMESRYSSVRPHLSELCGIPPQNLILVDIVQCQFRAIPAEEQKLKGMNKSCIYAYEFHSTMNTTKSARNEQQSFSEIQRNVQSPTKKQHLTNGETTISTNGKPKPNEVSTKTAPKPTKSTQSASGAIQGSDGMKTTSSQWICGGIAGCFKHSKKTSESESETNANPVGPSASKTLPTDSSSHETTHISPLKSSNASAPSGAVIHSRQGSSSSSSGSSVENGISDSTTLTDIGDCQQGVLVALHRKMMPQEIYFLSMEKYRPMLFGIPLIVPCNETTTLQDLYKSVWTQVSRLVSPLPPRDSSTNHATDCDDSLRYEYPFNLKTVTKDGSWCSRCSWQLYCRGCPLPCSAEPFQFSSSNLAIDWDQTALHLRYLSAQEKSFKEDPSVGESLRAATESITLKKCLEAFTREEELGEDEKYYCSICKTHQLAIKKFQLWRLPPILIVHFKRFHFVNGRWIKSHKIVDFPIKDFDPTPFLAAVPGTTVQRYRALRSGAKPIAHGTIAELSEPNSLETITQPLHEINIQDDDEDGDEEEVFGHENHNPPPMCNGGVEDGQKPDTRPMVSHPMNGEDPIARRKRMESTSLLTHTIKDDQLEDFHQHKLVEGHNPLEINYKLYSMVSHSGVLAGGHYVSYGKHNDGKWYLQNDSACKPINEDQMDKSTAYLLFYEREGLCKEAYLPKVEGKSLPDIRDLDEELETDFKKNCSVM